MNPNPFYVFYRLPLASLPQLRDWNLSYGFRTRQQAQALIDAVHSACPKEDPRSPQHIIGVCYDPIEEE